MSSLILSVRTATCTSVDPCVTIVFLIILYDEGLFVLVDHAPLELFL